jgi:hypothetical protein
LQWGLLVAATRLAIFVALTLTAVALTAVIFVVMPIPTASTPSRHVFGLL